MKKFIIIIILILLTITTSFFVINTKLDDKQELEFGWVNFNENCGVYDFYFQTGDSLLWDGKCYKGNANGLGLLKKIRNNNLLYDFKGGLVNGIKFGAGQENYVNGGSYEGNFYYDFHGKGSLEFPNSKESNGIFNLGSLVTGVNINLSGNATYLYNYREVDVDFAIEKGFISSQDSLTFIQKPTIKPEINKKLIYFYNEDLNKLDSSDGATFYRVLTLTSENIPKDNLVQDFWLNGNIQSKYNVEYVDVNYPWLLDVYNGTQVEYYENGKPSDTINYVMGKIEGKSFSYSEDGFLLTEEDYKNDKIENTTEYYISGNVKSKRNYVNEKQNSNSKSEYSEYYDGGKKKLIKKFDNEYEIPGQTIEYLLDGSAKKIYQENFNLNQKKWLGSFPGWDIDKDMNLVVNNSDLILQVIPINYSYKNDFSVQVEFEKTEGENLFGSGIIFNYIDIDNHMKFLFSSDGYFSLYKISEGVSYNYNDWSKTPIIKKDSIPNKLKIIKHSKTTTYYINNQLVLEDSRSLTAGNDFGFVADKGKYIIKDFEFVEFIKNLEPEPDVVPVPEPESIPEPETIPEAEPLPVDKSDTKVSKKAKDKETTEQQLIKEIRKELNKKSLQREKKVLRKWNSSGSGIIISKDGMIATNHHVIKGAKYIGVEVENDKGKMMSYNADVIKVDETNDLAVLKINDNDFNKLSSIKYNYSSKIAKTGAVVYALGFPYAIDFKKLNQEGFMGKEIKFTDGRISARTGIRGNPVYYQTTVPLQPGNSGGPLFDAKANLIGINVAKLKNNLADNVSYTIKSLFLENLVNVIDEDMDLPSYTRTGYKSIEDQIEILRKYVAIIKVVK